MEKIDVRLCFGDTLAGLNFRSNRSNYLSFASKLMAYFTDNVDDEVAECNFCGKSFSLKEEKNGENAGTNSMKYHLEKEHANREEVKRTLKEIDESKKDAPPTNKQNIKLIMRVQVAKPMPQDCAESA